MLAVLGTGAIAAEEEAEDEFVLHCPFAFNASSSCYYFRLAGFRRAL